MAGQVLPLTLELPSTLSWPFRHVVWQLGEGGESGVAVVWQAKCRKNGEPGKWHVERYQVTEVFHPAGRAFAVVKVRDDGMEPAERRDVEFPERGYPSCDCEGFSYEATQKADRRYGFRTSQSCGCRHVDLCRALAPHVGYGTTAGSEAVESHFGPAVI